MSEDEVTVEDEVNQKSFSETVIPDKSTVTSQISMVPQSMGVNYDELETFFDLIKEKDITDEDKVMLEKGANIAIENLKPGEEKWDKIVTSGLDEDYTLGRCIKEDANTCFQRAVFFNLLMQQVGISVQTLEGAWTESDRENLNDRPESVRSIKPDSEGKALYVGESDETEGHIWNIVEIGEKHYLVDTSFLIEKDGAQQPIIQEIDYEPDNNHLAIALPSGRTRHYVADGAIKIEPQADS